MAEFGKIRDLGNKENQTDSLQSVADFLINTNHQAIFSQLEKGDSKKVVIDGERIFAIFQKYDSKDGREPIFEAHRKFIDVQYVHSGSEAILVSNGDEAMITQAYDVENDFELFQLKQWSTLHMTNGMAAVLYPKDLHAPGIQFQQSELIEKIVVKVAVE